MTNTYYLKNHKETVHTKAKFAGVFLALVVLTLASPTMYAFACKTIQHAKESPKRDEHKDNDNKEEIKKDKDIDHSKDKNKKEESKEKSQKVDYNKDKDTDHKETKDIDYKLSLKPIETRVYTIIPSPIKYIIPQPIGMNSNINTLNNGGNNQTQSSINTNSNNNDNHTHANVTNNNSVTITNN